MIRKIKQYSDRGSIKNIANAIVDGNFAITQLPPTASELRVQKLFEYAQKNNDKELQDATGFITTDYIGDKTALPLSVYRIRKIVDDIKSKSPGRIEQLSQEYSDCFPESLSDVLGKEYRNQKAMIKNASAQKYPLFWRVSK